MASFLGGRRMRTAIHKFMADQIGDLRERVRELFNEQDYDPNQQDMEGNSYLHHVLRMEAHLQDDAITVPLVYVFGNAGIDATILNDVGEAALHLAVQMRCTPMMIGALMKIGADPLQPNKAGATPLRLALRHDDDTYLTMFIPRPGMYEVAKTRDFRKIEYLANAYYKTDPMRFGVKLSDFVQEDPDVQFAISKHDTRSQFFHACMADDVLAAREYFYLIKDFKVDDVVDPLFFDDKGQMPMTLMGYALMLNLPDVAQFLLEMGADVNRRIEIDENTKVPLFWYCMSNARKIDYGSAYSFIIHKADIASLRKDAASVLYLAWLRKWPLDIVQPLAKARGFISRRNCYGHTARDLILIKSVTARMITWREELYFIDRHVRDMLDEYDFGRIEELILSGYEQVPRMTIQLPEPLGAKPSLAERNKMENAKKLKELLESYSELKKTARVMFSSIESGNMPEFREALMGNPKAIQVLDKASRTMLHLAVIFDRRLLAKWILERYPELVPKKDIFGRSALHYAAALEESSELEEWLKQNGASFNDMDIYELKPMDYDTDEGLAMVEDERGKLYGTDAYCLEMYVRFEEAIKKGNMDLVHRLKNELNEVPIEVLTRDMYSPPQYAPPREIIFIAVDEDKEAIATWLLKNGAAWDVTSSLVSRRTPKPVNLYTAASLKGMEQVKRLIMQKEQEFKKQKAVENAIAEEERLRDVERQMKFEEKMIREGNLDEEIMEDLNDDAPDGWDEDGKHEMTHDEMAMEEGRMLQQQQIMQQQQQQQQQAAGSKNGTKGCSVM